MKNLPRLTERLLAKPWLVTPSHFATLHYLLNKAKAGFEDMIVDPESDKDNVTMVVENGTAMIPIYGTIGNNLGALERMCMECTDIRNVKGWLDQAVNDANVETIFLDINSPGGEVTYVDAVANYIKEAGKKKDVVAYCNDVMASAGYYLAAGANEIWAHPASCCIGSIGVYMAFLDESKAYEMEGVKLELVKAGKFKAEGMPGTSISDAYRDYLQQSVTETYNKFTAFVSSNRNSISMDDMQGLTYDADEALKKGFIDKIVEDPMKEFVM